jgi:hypothetical protein
MHLMDMTTRGSAPITWENARPAAEQAAVAASLAHPGVVETTLARLYGKTATKRMRKSFGLVLY